MDLTITPILNEYKYYFDSCNIVDLGYTFKTGSYCDYVWIWFDQVWIKFELGFAKFAFHLKWKLPPWSRLNVVWSSLN